MKIVRIPAAPGILRTIWFSPGLRTRAGTMT
jgi:hypothetical protein